MVRGFVVAQVTGASDSNVDRSEGAASSHASVAAASMTSCFGSAAHAGTPSSTPSTSRSRTGDRQVHTPIDRKCGSRGGWVLTFLARQRGNCFANRPMTEGDMATPCYLDHVLDTARLAPERPRPLR